MSAPSYMMLFEQDAKSALTLEDFASAILSMVEEAEKRRRSTMDHRHIRGDVLHAIEAACVEVLSEILIDISVGEAKSA